MFQRNSRYANETTKEVPDRRGRTVLAVTIPEASSLSELGEHIRRDGQRLDHLANFYGGEPTHFWRVAELNDVMLPDALAEVERIRIPVRAR